MINLITRLLSVFRSHTPRRPNVYRPRFDCLESRVQMSRTAVLDFDGENLTADELRQGGFDHRSSRAFSAFRDLFYYNNADTAYLDMNDDGVVNGLDADQAIARIVAKVRADFAPYDLNIILGNHSDNAWRLTNAQVGDVIVMITGPGGDFQYTQGERGVSPWADIGNEHDEIAFAWGGNIVSAYSGWTTTDPDDAIVNSVARTISHEMGHCFGLGHIFADGTVDASTHHMMSVAGPTSADRSDFWHDFNFQDIAYESDVLNPQYAHHLSVRHPEFNTATQNAHAYFSHRDVLGPSPRAWMAVLKPGELTVMGTEQNDIIEVGPARTGTEESDWRVVVRRDRSIVPLLQGTVVVDVAAFDPNSLNPFDANLAIINIHGKGGGDRITVAATMSAKVNAWGGRGADTIFGALGDDMLDGGDENDTLHGGKGHDQLFGQKGLDSLFGEEGDDLLDGGMGDGKADVMRGGVGMDTYRRRKKDTPMDQLLDADGVYKEVWA